MSREQRAKSPAIRRCGSTIPKVSGWSARGESTFSRSPPFREGLPALPPPVFRATIGGLLCGIPLEGGGRPRLLAVGGPDCAVVQLRREQLLGLGRPELAVLLTGWIRGLTDGVALRRATGKVTLLEPGLLQLGPTKAPARASRSCGRATSGGTSHFLGKGELPLGSEDGFFPFAGAGWLAAGADGAPGGGGDGQPYWRMPAGARPWPAFTGWCWPAPRSTSPKRTSGTRHG